jgi:hypothetical protein
MEWTYHHTHLDCGSSERGDGEDEGDEVGSGTHIVLLEEGKSGRYKEERGGARKRIVKVDALSLVQWPII